MDASPPSSKSLASTRWLWIATIITVAIGIFFRFYHLDYKVFWYDEAFTLLRMAGYQRTDIIQNLFTGEVIDYAQLFAYQTSSPAVSLGVVLQSLMADVHTPLYFVLLKLWINLFGDAIATVRACSVLLSFLCLPAAYWLCREAFPGESGHHTGLISILLVAISPIQVLYAQEARMYSLVVLTTLVIHAALLRVVRTPKVGNWLIYGFCLILGLYSHFVIVLIAGANLVAILYLQYRQQWRLSLVFFPYLLTVGISFLSLVPWIILLYSNRNQVSETISLGTTLPLFALVKQWLRNTTQLFVDFGYSEYFFIWVLFLCSLALIVFWRRGDRVTVPCLTLTLLLNWLPLIAHDLLLAGAISVRYRYSLPACIILQIIVAFWLSEQLLTPKRIRQRIGSIILASVVLLGIFSCGISAQANYWWNKGHNRLNTVTAEIINQSEQPLLIATPYEFNVIDLLSMSHLFTPEVDFLLFSEPEYPKSFDRTFDDYTDVFAYNLPAALQQKFATKYTLQQDRATEKLIRLSRNSPS
jgi:uncharacterized membrane protein